MTVGLSIDAETIRNHSTRIAIYGVVLIILGAVAIMAPGFATLAAASLFGWLLLLSGLVGLVAVAAGSAVPGFWWNLVSAILCVVAGIALLWNPLTGNLLAGALTLTIILAAYLIATGVTKIGLAVDYKRVLPPAWRWMLLSALIDFGLAAVIFSGLPSESFSILGLLIGLNLLFKGVAVVVAATYSRKLNSTVMPSSGRYR
jgi:uncharacterized membrane protein HdeD (DUF308 family)